MKTQIWIAVSVYVLIAIVRKRLGLKASLYTLLQVISVTVFEKIGIKSALSHHSDRSETDVSNRGESVGAAAGQAGRNRPLT